MSALAIPTRFKPWRDRRGQWSALKGLTFALLWLPALWIFYRYTANDLGAKPLNAAIHETGLWSVRLLLVTLLVTPFRLITGWAKILQVRRMLGVGAFAYALLHVILYIIDQNGVIWTIITEIVLRFYLTIGFVSFAAMAAMAWTSRDASIREMGAEKWRRLHMLIYPLTALAVFHGVLQSKIEVSEGLVMAGLLLALMGVRRLRHSAPLNAITLTGVALAAAVSTAGLEFLWYKFATRIPAERVFAANFNASAQPRPALMVLCICLAAVIAMLIWRSAASKTPNKKAPA